jgi:uncharacterized protein YlxW (UPF0749 family)
MATGDLVAGAALAIGLDIHPHPKLSETIGMAAEMFEGSRRGTERVGQRAPAALTSEEVLSMALKQDFAKQIEAQISVWQAQIKDHQEQLKQAGAKAQADAEKAVKQLQQQAEEAKKLLTQVRDASEAAWKDVHAASRKAFEQLQKGWADALKRFS